MVNSSAPAAYDASGGTIRADSHEIVGGIKQTVGVIGPINTGAPPIADPLRKIPVPYLPDYPLRNNGQLVLKNPGPVTLAPGVYRDGILLNGTGAVTLLPGLYLMDGGGLVRKGTSSVFGSGVMIYNTGKSKDSVAGVIDLDGSTNLDEAGPVRFEQEAPVVLTPPTSGPYTGICVFQARHLGDDPHVHFEPSGSVRIEGAIYAANSHLHLAGKGGASTDVFAAIICRNVDANLNGAIEVVPGSIRPRVPDVRLVD